MSKQQGLVTATRREFLQAGAAVAGTMAASAKGVAQSKEKRPNILFILGEGHRWDCLSIAGHPILKTPNHDRIGHEGARFTNAFCTNALCAPARATILTGLWSRTSGMLDNKAIHSPMPSDIPIITDLLHEAGYEVALVGKAHVRNGVKERYWDYYFGFNAPNTNYYAPKFAEGRKGVIGEEKEYHQYADDLVTDKALAWLKEDRGDKPWALLLWYQTPHAPFFRPRRLLDLYNGVHIPKPPTFDDDLKGYPGKPKPFVDADNKIGTLDTQDAVRSLEELCKDYYAGIVALDENVGRMFDYMQSTGQMDDTAIMHTSDHGFLLGEWRLFDKRLMHEPSIRIPMMLRYPKRIKPGVVRDAMVLDVDIAPTLLDLAGVKIPANWEGKSMLPLTVADQPDWRDEWLYDYYEYPGWENVMPHRGVRTKTHKLIDWYTNPGTFEMYDLVNDPLERTNLYGNPEYAGTQKDLHVRLERMLRDMPTRKEA
ncbi:MAG: sulfatase [Bryocella sp.]